MEILKKYISLLKNPFLNDLHIDNISISNRISSGEKNHKDFNGYIDDYKIKRVSIILTKIKKYVKSYDGGTKWNFFLIEDGESLKRYSDVWRP